MGVHKSLLRSNLINIAEQLNIKINYLFNTKTNEDNYSAKLHSAALQEYTLG